MALTAFRPPVVTRSRSKEPSVPAWKQTQEKNRAEIRAAYFEQFGEDMPERQQDRPISPLKAAKKKTKKASNPDEEEFRPEEEEEEEQSEDSEDSETDKV